MSIFYSHRERFRATGGGSRLAPATLVHVVARRLRILACRAGAAFGIVHQGIVTAKTRRLQRELLLHGGARDEGPVQRHLHDVSGIDRDASEFAQRPLLLGDKWDF